MSSPSISVMKLRQGVEPRLAPCASRAPSPNSARASESCASCTPCESSVTCSCSGHFVALMRLRRSARSASGALKEKGRIASALVVPICASPWSEGWLGRACPAAARCLGSRLTAPAAAEAARRLRRVGDDDIARIMALLRGRRKSASRL